MKLCILKKKIPTKPLHHHSEHLLYYIPIEEYRKQLLKGNVISEEDTLLLVSIIYARDVLKGRFELVEDMISKYAFYSYEYAKIVIKGRFIQGEEAINKHSYYKFIYNQNIL